MARPLLLAPLTTSPCVYSEMVSASARSTSFYETGVVSNMLIVCCGQQVGGEGARSATTLESGMYVHRSRE